MKVLKHATHFSKADEGGVTVDWVVLCAAISIMIFALMATLSNGLDTATNGISTQMSGLEIGSE